MSGNMSAALGAVLLAAIVLAACGASGAPGQPVGPAQIQATPAVQRTTLPSGSPGVPDYGY